MLKILIADDHFAVRVGLEMLVQDVVEEEKSIDFASDGSELIELISSKFYDVLLTDLNMPGIEGLPLLQNIRKLSPHTHILVISVNSEEFYSVKVHELGGFGFVHKGSSDADLKEAIFAVCHGEKYLSAHQQQLINEQNDHPFVNLSKRELEVLNLLFNGYGVLEISNQLNIGQTTASTFKSRILKKTSSASVVELIKLAEKYGFIPDSATQ